MNKVLLSILILGVIVATYLLYNKRMVSDSTPDKKLDMPVEGAYEKTTQEKISELEQNRALKTAVLAGGCFWCMEGPFEVMDGVEEAIAGYAGGTLANPTYEQVSSGRSGYREAVKIYYDPAKLSFKELLEKYWFQIDPTDPGGQFADRGEQYKTAIYYMDDDEKEIAEDSKKTLGESGRFDEPIVTDILQFTTFHPAEEYHQDYYMHSAERYKKYKKGSGREDFINQYSK